MTWSSNLAYAVGLITTDGSLSIDGRHINLTSKDIEQLETFAKILDLQNKIGIKKSSFNPNGKYFQIQFGNVKLYRFLLRIGLMPNKTKILGSLKIPDKYFADFLRGHLDGDGCTYSYWDPRWKSSFMFYTVFMSASKDHLKWIQEKTETLFHIKGRLTFHGRSYFHLRFAKGESIRLMKLIYYKSNFPCLGRKRFKIEKALGIINTQAGMGKLVNPLP